MNKSPLKVAQIGVGGYGRNHLTMIRSYAESGAVQLLCVADPAIQQLEEGAHFTEEGVHCYTDYLQMFEEQGDAIDIVNIATPIPLHDEMITAALKHTRAFIHVEKPPVPTLQQLEKLITLDSDTRVNVAFQHVSTAPIRQTRKWVESGHLGNIQAISVTACWPRFDRYYDRASWPGTMSWNGRYVFDGPATNANSHWVNNIMYIMGSGEDFAVPETIVGELYRARPIQSYDTCSIGGVFKGGAEFTINFSHACCSSQAIGNFMHIIGDKGWLTVDERGQTLENSLGLTIEPELESRKNDRFYNYHEFLSYIRGTRKLPPCTLKNMRGYVATTIGALLSSGKIHDIPEALIGIYETSEDRGYEIKGIVDLILKAKTRPALISQLAPDWGISGKPIRAEEILSLPLSPFFNL